MDTVDMHFDLISLTSYKYQYEYFSNPISFLCLNLIINFTGQKFFRQNLIATHIFNIFCLWETFLSSHGVESFIMESF